jgi:hypothetical protein
MKTAQIAALGAGLAATLLSAGAAWAHHSTAMFHWDQEQTLTGTVEQFEYTNPHSWIWFRAPDPTTGKVERWGLEGMSPNALSRNGWSKNSIKPGDRISMVIHPLRDTSRHGGFTVSVTLPSGKSLRELPMRPVAEPSS